MINIKQLFLTLSLLTALPIFSMDPATKKARTDAEKWMLIKTNEDLAQHAEHIIATRPLEATSGPNYYFVEPTPPALRNKPDDHLYILYACKRGSSPRTFNFSCSNHHLAQFPWYVRPLTFEEAHDLHNGIQSQDILVNDEILSLEDGYTGQLVPVLPDEGRGLFTIGFLTKKAQIDYAVHNYLKFPKTLLGIRRFRHSALSALQTDVVRLICKIAISDAIRNDIPLEFE
jgi:hypothetical protein